MISTDSKYSCNFYKKIFSINLSLNVFINHFNNKFNILVWLSDNLFYTFLGLKCDCLPKCSKENTKVKYVTSENHQKDFKIFLPHTK